MRTMDRYEPLFRKGDDSRHPEQQPPMRQQGDRWPDELENIGSAGGDDARPPVLDGV